MVVSVMKMQYEMSLQMSSDAQTLRKCCNHFHLSLLEIKSEETMKITYDNNKKEEERKLQNHVLF